MARSVKGVMTRDPVTRDPVTLPATSHGKPVGIVSIGDLAVERDPRSALAAISAAPANG